MGRFSSEELTHRVDDKVYLSGITKINFIADTMCMLSCQRSAIMEISEPIKGLTRAYRLRQKTNVGRISVYWSGGYPEFLY